VNPALKTTSSHRRRLALISVGATCAVALGACGASSPATTAGHDAPPSRSQIASVLRFTECVRSHGVPSIPDPGTRGWKDTLASQAPAVLTAERTCARLVPGAMPRDQSQNQTQNPRQTSDELAFAVCMRAHGFRSFPDPTSGGQITHEMLAAAGIDVHQPAALQAADACVSVTGGVITKADVARFVAGR
jgi:hypothetical protein